MRILITICLLLLSSGKLLAQLPNCRDSTRHYIYYSDGPRLWMFDPHKPVSDNNPRLNDIVLPDGATGIAISKNLFGTKPEYTFYVVSKWKYHYYDGTQWVNTNHGVGSFGAVNIAGSPNYLFSYDCTPDIIYRYDGKSDSKLLLKIPAKKTDGPWDLHADNEDNFYVLRMSTGFRKYNAEGVLQKTWEVKNGSPDPKIHGPGLAVIANELYYQSGGGLYWGNIDSAAVNFTHVLTNALPANGGSDFATCPLAVIEEEMIAEANEYAKMIFFETASAEIKKESFAQLDKLAAMLNKHQGIRTYIEGHTDNVGTPQYNLKLSEKRADAVKRYLSGKGVAADRMHTQGFGATKPLDNNKTEQGKAKNRRIVITLGT